MIDQADISTLSEEQRAAVAAYHEMRQRMVERNKLPMTKADYDERTREYAAMMMRWEALGLRW